MGELYIQYEYWVAAFQLVTAMFGMGATLTVNDFRDVVREPRSVTIGTLVQLMFVPLVAILFITITGSVGGIAIGIALIAAIPGGTTSNIFTFMARGNVPLSISITGLTSLACLISTPLILGVLITEYLPTDFSMPTNQIVSDIALTLLLPLIVGMICLRLLPKQSPTISKWSIRASLFGIMLIILGSSNAGRLDIEAFGTDNMILMASFAVVLAVSSWLISRYLGLSKTDGTAVEMEVIVRNINLGVLIKASMFPAVAGTADPVGDTVLFAVLLYGMVQMLLAAALIFARRRNYAAKDH